MPGAMVQAGVLDEKGEKLSDPARAKAVEDCKNERAKGTVDGGFPCGPKIPPMPNAELFADLGDELIYPDWHKLFLGTYLKMAIACDVDSQQPLLPIGDPFVTCGLLDASLPDCDLPTLLATIALPIPGLIPVLSLTLPPVDLPPKLIPKLPPKFPDFKFPGVPEPIPEIGFSALLDYYISMTFDVPMAALKVLIGKMPGLALKLPSAGINVIFTAACEAVFGALPPISADLFAQVTDTKVMAIKCAECIAFAAVASTLGCVSPQGKPAPPPKPKEDPNAIADPHPNDPTVPPPKEVPPAKPPTPSAGGVGLVGVMGAEKGYTKSQLPEETDPDIVKALSNGLMKLPKSDNYRRLFLKRKMFYADPFTIELIKDLGGYLKKEFDFILEVGNLTGIDRQNKWSRSHFGGAFDLAYPYFKHGTKERDIGVRDSNAIELDGEFEGEKTNNPYKFQNIEDIDYAMLYNIINYILVIAKDKYPTKVIDKKNPILAAILIGESVIKKLNKYMKDNDLKLPVGGWAPEKGHDDHIHFAINRSRVKSGNPDVDGPLASRYEVGENFFIGPPKFVDKSKGHLA